MQTTTRPIQITRNHLLTAASLVALLFCSTVHAAYTWKQISVGHCFACGIKKEGTLWCWGDNSYGQLGVGYTSATPTPYPTRVGRDVNWMSVYTSETFACGLKEDGTRLCWGGGALGLGDTHGTTKPTAAINEVKWRQLALGIWHACGVTMDGWLFCWGQNFNGALGLGSGDDQLYKTTPAQIGASNDWISVTAGESHTCAVTFSNGTRYCWGNNDYGQLGVGDTINRFEPTPAVTKESSWLSVIAGAHHTCGIRWLYNRLYCWGANTYGQLGVGDYADRYYPQQVGSQGWSLVSSSAFGLDTCAIATGGSRYCWGLNQEGELGIGDAYMRNAPRRLNTEGPWLMVSVGQLSTCGIRTDSTLWCWGSNYFFELGLSDPSDRASRHRPTLVDEPAR